MASDRKALAEKIRQRRRALQDTLEDTQEPTTQTWGSQYDEESNIEMTSLKDSGAQMLEEVNEAETLMKDLKSRRQEKKKQLDRSLQSQREDVSGEIRKARRKSRQKLKDEKEGEEDEEEEGMGEEAVNMPAPHPLLDRVEIEGEGVEGDVTGAPPGDDSQQPPQLPDGPPPPPATGLSLKERLRNKIKKEKEKGESDTKAEVGHKRTLKGLRERLMPSTRFDDPSTLLRQDDLKIGEQVEKSMDLRNKWRKVSEKASGQTFMPTREEAADFFTNTYEDEEDQEEKAARIRARFQLKEAGRRPSHVQDDGPATERRGQGDGPQGEDGAGESETAAVTAAEELGPIGSDKPSDRVPLLLEDGLPVYVSGPEYMTNQERMDKEKDLLYTPSVISIPDGDKVGKEKDPRFAEEEGFYVGSRPPVISSNQNRMEHRLLMQPDGKGLQWFGEDGRILALPDPVREIPSRPPIPESLDSAIDTEYRKAITKEFDSRYIDGSLENHGRYQLDIDLNTVTFSHHHLFSKEHVLSNRLERMCREYRDRGRRNVTEYLSEKVRAIKGAMVHLNETVLNRQEAGEDEMTSTPASAERRLKDYRFELNETKKLLDTEYHSERDLLKNIIKTWKSMKEFRTLQRATNTSVQLVIKRQEKNKRDDETKWKRETEEEVADLREEYEIEYKLASEKYKEDLAAFKKQQKARRLAQSRMKVRKARSGGGSRGNVEDIEGGSEEDEKQEEDDMNVMNQPVLSKPSQPTPFDEKAVRAKVKDKMMLSRRRPGEPLLIPDLTHSATITPSGQCSRAEQLRREAVQKCRIFLRVLFNGKEVHKTPSKSMSQDFTVTFAQISPLQILQWPDTVQVVVLEEAFLGGTTVAEVFIPIPDCAVLADSVQLDNVDFSSDLTVSHPHEGVGSGVPIHFGGQEQPGGGVQTLYTTGCVAMSVAWGLDADGTPLVPSNAPGAPGAALEGQALDPVAAIGASAMVDMEKLSKWIKDSRLDPNDPSNADLVYLLRSGDGLQLPSYFRLEQLQEEFNFCSDEDIESDKRLQLLQYRQKEVPEFRNLKMIPAMSREVGTNAFEDYERRLKSEAEVEAAEEENHRSMVKKFLKRIRESVMRRVQLASHQKCLQDVIDEDAVPNIAAIVINIGKVVEPRHPLRPSRRERKKITGPTLQDKEVKILLNIIRAYDVPVRVDSSAAPTAGSETAARTTSVMKVLVRPYVEVTFQRQSVTTAVAEGPNPSWNEELQLPFRAPNDDYSATTLQSVNDNLYLNLFDELVTDVLEDNRERGRTVHQRLDKRFLGSIKIPFSTLYNNSAINGTFRLESPPFLLGYKRDAGSSRVQSTSLGPGAGFEVGMGKAEHTYLNVFITLEPQLGAVPQIRQQFDSNEGDRLLEASLSYSTDLDKKFPTRERVVEVIDVNGKTVFVCRYFKPLNPPQLVLDISGDQMMNVARFVSLIPYVSDMISFPGLFDIWSTCDQFLQMLAGDEEEHSVLLTNYFLHMKKDAYLCIGTAIPEGATAYTLVKESIDSATVWNGMKGESYSTRDAHCPMTRIGCLINSDNIWANIQQTDSPNRMSFDLTNAKSWRPFFTSKFPKPPGLESVQPAQLLYSVTEEDEVYRISDKLEKTLRDKFMQEWRPKKVTRWNRHCSSTLKSMLIKFEEARGGSIDHAEELNRLLTGYTLSGFPINFPYSDNEPLIEAVYATNVWDNDSPHVEFALAVHVHPYPSSVLSVWVYVASLTRNQ